MSPDLERAPPQQIAAQALLAIANWRLGDSEAYRKEALPLRKLTPTTDVDRLLTALAFVLLDPRESHSLLRAAPKAERTAIGLLIRGIVRVHIGCDNQDADLIDDAIRDIDCARLLAYRDTVGMGHQLYAISAAIELARSEGRDEDVVKYVQDGRLLADQPVPDNPTSHFGRWACFRAAKQTKAATQAIRQIGRYPGYDAMVIATDCLQRLDASNALAAYDDALAPKHSQTDVARIARIHLSAPADVGSEETNLLIKRMLSKKSSFDGLLALYTLCRIAKPSVVHERAREFASGCKNMAHFENELFGNVACVRVLADGDEAACLGDARGSAFAQSQAYYTIGMLRLAYKERDAAYDNFKRAVETNAVGTYGYEWARAYKEQMEKDPHWPYVSKD